VLSVESGVLRDGKIDVRRKRQEWVSGSGRSDGGFCLEQSTSPAGFTLLEVLVAMGVLMLIVMMMATLFHSSTTAWENGLRQAEISLEARAVMNMIQRDLSHAVADPELECQFARGSVQFYRPDISDSTNRTMTRVRYAFGSRAVTRVQRRLIATGTRSYGRLGSSQSAPLLEDVESFSIDVPGGDYSAYTTNLPAWVEISMELSQSTVASANIRVSSGGRDLSSTDDDIKTWQ
jgi:hypothetical protein